MPDGGDASTPAPARRPTQTTIVFFFLLQPFVISSTLPLDLAVAHCSDPLCVRKVLLKVSKRHVSASALLIVVLLSCVYAFQTPAPEQIKGATVQFRIYEQTAEGATNELGSKTAYLSRFGNWTTIKRNVQGVTEQTLIADRNRAGVFMIDSVDTATKMSDFAPDTTAISKSQYRKFPQFAGEVTFFGHAAYVEKIVYDGKLVSELTFIPFIRQPVKMVNFNDDGSKKVEEAVSIELREPDEEKVKLPDKMIVTTDASDQFKPRQKVGEKRP